MGWRLRAQCAGEDPRVFETAHLDDETATKLARALCGGCPVMEQCRTEYETTVDMPALLGTQDRAYSIPLGGVIAGGQVFKPWTPADCASCNRTLRERGEPAELGQVVKHAKNMCSACYKKELEHGEKEYRAEPPSHSACA